MILTMKNTRRRGSTLAEMVIVMAVLAIMTAMVVSFSSICGAWTRLGIYRYNLQNEEKFMRTLISTYVSVRDEAGYSFGIDQSGNLCWGEKDVSNNDKTDKLVYNSETHQLIYGPYDTSTYTFEFAEKIEFSVETSSGSGVGQLVTCRVYYTPPPLNGRQASQQTFTIMVAARSTGYNALENFVP